MTPTPTQARILDALSSCSVVIIPNTRAYGISTVLRVYSSWELRYNEDMIAVTYATIAGNKSSENHELYHYNYQYKDYSNTYKNGANTLAHISINELDTYMRGKSQTPTSLLVIDSDTYMYDDMTFNILDIMRYSMRNMENSVKYAMCDSGCIRYNMFTVNPWERVTYREVKPTHPRLVVRNDDPKKLGSYFINMGYSMDDIAIIELPQEDALTHSMMKVKPLG